MFAGNYYNRIRGRNVAQVLKTFFDAPADPRDYMANAFPTHFGPPNETIFLPATPTIPRVLAVKKQGLVGVFILGTASLAHINGIVNGYRSGPPGTDPYGANPFFSSAAAQIKSWLETTAFLQTTKMYLHGHSFGGAIAHVLSHELTANFAVRDIETVTFGAPRTGWRAFQLHTRMYNSARWMNDGDPVPCVPPSPADAPAMHALLPQAESLRFADARHPLSGIFLRANGTAEDREEPWDAALSLTTNLVTWLSSTQGASDNNHSIGTYYDRLNIGAASEQALANAFHRPSTAIASAERRDPVNPQQVQQIANQVANQVQAAGDAIASVPVRIPRRLQARVRALDGMYAVEFMDAAVMLDHRRSRCITVAKGLNRTLRALQRAGRVNQATLQQRMAAFLAEAGSPSPDLSPTMNVGENME